jgi:hypothetical protein
MTTQVAKVIFNDSASKFNRDLVDFLKRNLETAIRRGRISFSFKIAETNELPQLRKQGIKRLPAMIFNNNIFIGVPDIIAEIRRSVKNSKTVAPVKSEEEIIRDFQMGVMGPVSKDAEGKLVIHDADTDDLKTEDIQAKVHAEIARRGIAVDPAKAGTNPVRKMRQHPQPRQPDRDAERDDEDDEDDDPKPRKRTQRAQPTEIPQMPRADNLSVPAHMADAMASLQRVGRTASAEDKRDDDMMATLLAKMGGDGV